MANREKGEIPFEHGGSHYTLVLNTAAMAKAQSRLNTRDALGRLEIIRLEEIQRLVLAGSLEHTLVVFWAGLQKYHGAQFTHPDHAAALCDGAEGQGAVRALMEAFGLQTPDPEDVKELQPTAGNPPKAQRRKRAKTGGDASTSRPAVAA